MLLFSPGYMHTPFVHFYIRNSKYKRVCYIPTRKSLVKFYQFILAIVFLSYHKIKAQIKKRFRVRSTANIQI